MIPHRPPHSLRFGHGVSPPRLPVDEIATVASRLVIMGDPVWYEVSHATGRNASWHGQEAMGNLLFLDGAVKYRETYPPPRVGPAVFEPKLR